MRRVTYVVLALSLAINGLTDELPDSFARIAGSEETSSLLKQFNELFVAAHPGLKITLLAKGSPSVAVYSLTTGVSGLALLDREIWPLEIRPFRQIHGYDPTGIRIGRAGFAGPGRMNPCGVYVNATNPLPGLTIDQVARIFTTGGGSGDITHWGQAGLSGQWSERLIHLYGPRDDGSLASAIRHAKMGGFPFARRYEPLSTAVQIIQAVADDRYGIGLVGPSGPGALAPAVRMLPLANEEGMPYSLAGFAEYLMVYVNRAAGKPLDSFIREYVQMILSREGQAIIAKSPQGYVRLPAREIAMELAKLGR